MNNKKNELPLVSVVMPSLNQAQFLGSAVRSVLGQDYPNLELVVADGMSTDGSVELLVSLQAEYGERIRWISQKDSGAAEAVNNALALAEGEIIGWLNSDDLYADDAISKAVEYLLKNPTRAMVYGAGQHINAAGEVLDDYPSRPPATRIEAFADGCFICQPTVFMRRSSLDQVGQLNSGIPTAFDFDLFVRFFKAFPGQIGMLKRVQAFSRLHVSCMTQRLRRQVALDGMHVIAKQLGPVPEHWFWTHVDEICAAYPLASDSQPLVKQIEFFLKQAAGYYKPEQLKSMVERLKADMRLRVGKPGLFATVQPDGWVSEEVAVKYRWTGKPASAVLLHCKAPWPVPGKLNLRVRLPDGKVRRSSVEAPEDFVMRFEVPHASHDGCIVWTVTTTQGFVPAAHNETSTDNRKLAFQVLGITTEI